MLMLRELEKKDLLIINRWRNDAELISHLGANYRFINRTVDELWFDNYIKNRDRQVRCVISSDEQMDDIYGLISLTNIDQINQTAEMHIMIGDKKNRGKGIGTFAIKEMLKHAFENLNLWRIELTVLETNNIAICCYEKNGFKKEGCMRDSVYKNGKRYNMFLYSIIKSEYK